MTYTHLSQTERYQIYALKKAGQTQTEIAHILGRHKLTISRKVARGSGRRGYRPRQAQNLSEERSQCSRNATLINEQILLQVRSLLTLQSSPEQIASQLQISHETIYQEIYADKAMGGHLWRSL
jgi:IS30 family transposase